MVRNLGTRRCKRSNFIPSPSEGSRRFSTFRNSVVLRGYSVRFTFEGLADPSPRTEERVSSPTFLQTTKFSGSPLLVLIFQSEVDVSYLVLTNVASSYSHSGPCIKSLSETEGETEGLVFGY